MSVINNIVKNDVTYAIQDARVDSITEVFEAEYNVTTFAAVLAKWNAGWTIVCNKNSNVLQMVDYSAGTFSFAATLGSSDLSTLQYSVAKLSASGWSADSENIQNKLTAGTNITISGNTISATGGASYTAAAPITITDNQIGISTSTASGLKINDQNQLSIDTDGYIQSKLTVNPASTTGTLTGLTIDGTNYAIAGGAEKFVATYDEEGTSTTYAQVLAAYNAGKLLYAQVVMEGTTIGDLIPMYYMDGTFYGDIDTTVDNYTLNTGTLILDSSGWQSLSSSFSSVSGVNDGTNWTSITIGNTTKAIPISTTYTASTGINITNNAIKAEGVEYTNNATAQSNALKFVRMTQAQYNALSTPDADTFYMIVG